MSTTVEREGAREGRSRDEGGVGEEDRISARPPRRPVLPSRGVAVALGVVFVALAAAGAWRWWWGLSHESTDDAQVDGHVIPILPKVGGFVQQVRVDDNQQVQAGDTLVILDSRDLRAQLAKAEAELAAAIAASGSPGRVGQAAAEISSARARAAAARAAVTQAEANAAKAARDVERFRALATHKIVSGQQLDAAETGARAAEAELAAAQRAATAADAQVDAAQAALRGADARVGVARAARDQAALQLSYTVLVAPESGVVSKRSAEVGQLVQTGQPLMALVPLDDVWVVANFKETQIEHVLPGDPAKITVDAYSGRSFAGHVESLSPATGAKFSLLPPDNATGNFTKVVQRLPVRVELDDPPDPRAPLRPGMSVEVTVTTK